MLAGEASAPRKRGWSFYGLMSGLLLLAALVGFAPTFFLRPFGSNEPLSDALRIHGTVLTAWFGLLFLQTALVRSRHVRVHRRLGYAGVVVAAAAVASSAWVLAVRDAPHLAENPGRGFGNLMSLAAFGLCFAAGVLRRHRPPDHRRLILMGSIVIVAPALSRIFYRPAGTSGPATAVVTILLLATVLGHDLVETRRPHRATLTAIVLIFVVAPAVTWGLIASGIWPAVLGLAASGP